jgi:hypothetical protein
MYSLSAILSKEPIVIAGALRSILYILVLAGIIAMDTELLAAVALAAEVVLGLFARQASTPVAAPELPAGTEVKVAGTEDTSTYIV